MNLKSICNFDSVMDMVMYMMDAYADCQWHRINNGPVVLVCGRIGHRLFFVDTSMDLLSLENTDEWTRLEKATCEKTRAVAGKIETLQNRLLYASKATPVQAVAVADEEDVRDLNRTTATPATSATVETALPAGDDAEIAEAAEAAGPLSSLTTPGNTPQKRKRCAETANKTANMLDTDIIDGQLQFLTTQKHWWNQQVEACAEKETQVAARVIDIQNMIQREEQRHTEEQQRHAERKSELKSMLQEARAEQTTSTIYHSATTMMEIFTNQIKVIEDEIERNKRTRTVQSAQIANAQKQMQRKLLEQQRAMQTKLQEQQAAMNNKIQEQQALMQKEMKQTFLQFIHQ